MKVMLIVPPYGLRADGKKIKQKKGFLPPIGPALLATILDNAGHAVKILDMQVDNFAPSELVAYLRAENPGIVCMSMLDATYRVTNEIFSLVKQNFPSIITVCGGIHPSMYPKETLQESKDIDYIIYGEAENTLTELVVALESGKDVSNVLGIYHRKGEEIVLTGYRPIVKNLDDFPIPSRKFFEVSRYVPMPHTYKRWPSTNMMTGRGCTYSLCTFCFESSQFVREKGYRRISVERALEEIRYLQKEYGIRDIVFWDDEFLMGGDWVEEFCDALVSNNIDITWSCYGKVNYVTPERVKKMAKAGCWNVLFGLESANQDILNFVKKGQTLDMMRNAVKWMHDAGIEVRGSFIFGLPTETPEKAQNNIDMAVALDLDYAMFTLSTPFKGTEMYDVCKSGKYGTYYGDGDYEKHTIASVVFLPKDYESAEQLMAIRNKAYKKFYLRPRYFLRKLKSIQSYDDVVRYWRGATWLLTRRSYEQIG